MNALELTELFVAYRRTADHLAELQAAIESEVLSLGESQKIAGVKATYYQPSLEYDYQSAAMAAGADVTLIKEFTTMRPSTSWKSVAEELCADLTAYATEKPARVVVK